MTRFSMWSALARCFCSTHFGTGSETTVEQESQQARASGIDSPKCYVEYAESYNPTIYEEESEFRSVDLDGINDIIISEKLSRAITKNYEFAAVGHGSETDLNNEPDVTPYATSGALASSRDALRADSDPRAYRPCHRRDCGLHVAQLALWSSSTAAIIDGPRHYQ